MAGTRKGWNNLSSAQRARYERAGVTRKTYESGASLASARGHGKTPERPERATLPHNAERYREYRENKKDLLRRLQAAKEARYGNRITYNPRHKYPQTIHMNDLRTAVRIMEDDDGQDFWDNEDDYDVDDGVHNLMFYH